jgi:hypothetical protein
MPDAAHKRKPLRLPVVSAGAEYLVMGYLMRRNIMAYKAPQNNEGYDLICIHPDCRHKPRKGQAGRVRVQVKSRYQSDSDRSFPIREESLDGFDFLVCAFLNIGTFFRGRGGRSGREEPVFYVLPRMYVRKHLASSGHRWREKIALRKTDPELEQYRNDNGFELIAAALGVKGPRKRRTEP